MINLCIIGGHAAADPQITETANGGKIATFRLCSTERGFTTNDGRVIPERNTWHNVTLMGRLANYAQYIHKGDFLLMRGKYHTREVEQDGQHRTYYNFDPEEILYHPVRHADNTPAPANVQ